MEDDADTPQDEGGEVVPFPGGRHPSQWPADEPDTEEPPDRFEHAAGDYEPLFDRAAHPEESPAPTERRDAADGTDDVAEWLGGRVPDDDDDFAFEDFATGADSFDEFTREDYIKATTQEYRGLAEAIEEASREKLELQAVAASMPGLDSGVVGFEDVTGEQPPAEEPRQPSDLSMRVVSGVVLVSVLVVAVVLGGFWLWLFIASIVLVALGEFYATVRRNGFAPVAVFGLLGGLGLFVAAYVAEASAPLAIAGALGLTGVAVTFWYAVVPRRNPLANATLTIFGVGWVAGLMGFAVPIVLAPSYRQLIVALVGATALLDAASYFAGRSFGRTKLAPSLSPGKTVEGLVGGIVAAFGFGAVISLIDWFGFDLKTGLLLAGVVSVSAPLGDLAESMLKRALNTKDMGAIGPGSRWSAGPYR